MGQQKQETDRACFSHLCYVSNTDGAVEEKKPDRLASGDLHKMRLNFTGMCQTDTYFQV